MDPSERSLGKVEAVFDVFAGFELELDVLPDALADVCSTYEVRSAVVRVVKEMSSDTAYPVVLEDLNLA